MAFPGYNFHSHIDTITGRAAFYRPVGFIDWLCVFLFPLSEGSKCKPHFGQLPPVTGVPQEEHLGHLLNKKTPINKKMIIATNNIIATDICKNGY